MSRATILGGGGGAHSVAVAANCPVCGHPTRIHSAFGCVKRECECVETPGAPTTPSAPPQPPSSRSLDLLDPVCGSCGHRRGKHAQAGSIVPCQRCNCRGFTAPEAPDASSTPPPGPVPGDLGPAPAGPAAVDAAGPDVPAARAPRRAGPGPGDPKAPRRQNPRPAGEALVCPAAVGGGGAGEEVAAPVATGAATSLERAATPEPPPAVAALEDVAALVERVLDHAYYFAARWFCPKCIAWLLDPGACPTCRSALQPVYLATIPRSLT